MNQKKNKFNRLQKKNISNKWIILFVITLSIFGLSYSFNTKPGLALSNIFLNSDFESWGVYGVDGPPDSWVCHLGLPADYIAASPRNSTFVRTGSYSAAISGSTNGYFVQNRIISTTIGITSFKAGCWVLDNTSGSVQIRFRVRNMVPSVYYGYFISNTTSNSDSWQFISVTISGVSITGNMEYDFQIDVVTAISASAPVFVDSCYFSDTASFPKLPDAPININGDSEFVSQAVSEGWSGMGTSGDPYIIENYFIEAGAGPGVSIVDTTAHFIMRNVLVQSYSTGFYLENVTNGQLIQNSAVNNDAGFSIYGSRFLNIQENLAMSNNLNGFEVYTSNYCMITGNNATLNTLSGIYVENSIGTTVELNNVSYNGDHGVNINSFADASVYSDNNIRSNNIFNNSKQGILLNNTLTNDISNNEIYGNGINGINLLNSNSTSILWNIIQSNQVYGVLINNTSHSNKIYENGFYANNGTGVQARDDGSGNIWYDVSTSRGNLWDDYSGSGSYLVEGISSSEDLFPLPYIKIDGPNDFEIAFGVSGYSLTWKVSATLPGANPTNYTVYQNNTKIQVGGTSYGNWTNTIIIPLSGLNSDLFNYTLIVFNDLGKQKSDTVWITVVQPPPDIILPIINSPSDITFEEGSIGYSITWVGSDANPWQAVILLNNTEIYNQYWIGEDIILDLDSLVLTAGTYNITCKLTDKAGNQINDTLILTVNVSVPDTTFPTLDPPSNILYIEGSTGNYLAWNGSDAHPFAYLWYINGTPAGYEPWHGGNFNISVDGLLVGIWNITLTVSDLTGNNVSLFVFVEVIPIPPDFTAPEISQPASLAVSEKDPGVIIWVVQDEFPDYYIINRNSTLVVSQGYWISGIIQYSFPPLPIGIWEFNLTIFDLSGNFNSSQVIVTVNLGSEIEFNSPIISEMPDLEFEYNSTGNKVTFRVFDQNPRDFQILLDSIQISYSPWNIPNQNVEVILDKMEIGSYNLTLIAYDKFNNSAFESLTIVITGDNTPPTVSSPDSIITNVGSTDTVSWTVSDVNLDYYELILLETGQVLDTGLINGTTDIINISLVDFAVGEYTLRLIVYDTYKHKTMNDVSVIIQVSKIIVDAGTPGFEILVLLPVIIIGSLFRTRRKRRNIHKTGDKK